MMNYFLISFVKYLTGCGIELGVILLTQNYPVRTIPESIDYHCKILHKYVIFDLLFTVIHNKISLPNAFSRTYISLSSD